MSLSKKHSNAPCYCPRSIQTHHVTVQGAFKRNVSPSKKYSSAPCHCPRSTQTHHVTVQEAFKRTMSQFKKHSNALCYCPRSIQTHHVTVQEAFIRSMPRSTGTCCSVFADMPVSSPRKLSTFLMKDIRYWMKVSQTYFIRIWTQKHWCCWRRN